MVPGGAFTFPGSDFTIRAFRRLHDDGPSRNGPGRVFFCGLQVGREAAIFWIVTSNDSYRRPSLARKQPTGRETGLVIGYCGRHAGRAFASELSNGAAGLITAKHSDGAARPFAQITSGLRATPVGPRRQLRASVVPDGTDKQGRGIARDNGLKRRT